MTLMGLDLNAGRVRGLCGPAGVPRPVLLNGNDRELPLAVSLEGRKAEVGRAGVAVCRRLPHLACVDFLPQLGEQREWQAGRHRIDAGKALTLVLEKLQPACVGVRGLALALPAYLMRPQAGLIAGLCTRQKLPILGSVAAPLALAWSAHHHAPWRGLAAILDADDHALTWSAIAADDSASPRQARVLLERTLPKLGGRAWKERLLNAVADRCIRQSRRDLRDSAEAEQTLFDQLDDAFDACGRGQMMELAIQAAHWYQNLILAPQEIVGFCSPLIHKTIEALSGLLKAAQAESLPALVLVSASAGRLPGLVSALREHTGTGTSVTVLPADAAARAAHELAGRWHSGALPSGHADVALPLARRAEEVPPASKPTSTDRGNTKLPLRGSKLVQAAQDDDDFSVGIDE